MAALQRNSAPFLVCRTSSSTCIFFLLCSSLIGFAFCAYCPVSMRNQTACTCEEYVDGAIVKCNGPKGPVVVESLKKQNVELRELVLENANIIEIGPRAFVGMRIKKLVLDNNKIKLIQKNAFRGLETVLQELSITSNRLTEVPTAALDGLRALNILNLRCNRIGNLTDVSFVNMPSLIEVHLACNKICGIAPEAFREVKQSVQNIILDNNCMEGIPSEALEDMNTLIALHMKHNQIEKLEERQLRNMTSLSLLTLTGNQISRISPNFTQNTPNLRYIYLGENQLDKLEMGAMKQFSAAEIIDLSYNNLGEISADMFNGMENLQHLNLEANAVKDIAPGAFATTPLLLLWLPHNCLGSVSPNMFQGAPFLKQVSLANNNIRSVQAFSFAHLANLHTLDLSNNKIQNIQPSAIMGSDFLTVRMQENPLVCTQDGFHVMNGREAINLTTEANLICKTDYAKDVNDQCPRKPESPTKKICCEAGSPQKSPSTTTTSTIVANDQTTSISTEPSTINAPIQLASASSSNNPMDQSSSSISPTTIAESIAKSRARQLNMERFYRLSRRPESTNVVKHHSNRRLLPSGGGIGQNGTVERHLQLVPKKVESNKENGSKVAEQPEQPPQPQQQTNDRQLPAHVAALINGGTTMPQIKRQKQHQREELIGKKEGEGRATNTEAAAAESAKVVSTTDIRKSAFPSPAFVDAMASKVSKHPHEHLQENGEFSKDAAPIQVDKEEKKAEVVVKQ